MNIDKWQKGIAPLVLIIIAVLALGGAIGGYSYLKQKRERQAAEDEQRAAEMKLEKALREKDEKVTEDAATGAVMVIDLSEQNGSGITGVATLSEGAGKVKVAVQLAGAFEGSVHPAHIHEGACPEPGKVFFPLRPIINGLSETELNTTLASLSTALPLAINVHKSAEEVEKYIACGDLPGSSAAGSVERPGVGNQGELIPPVPPVVSPAEKPVPPKVMVGITAKNFSFDPTEIRVKKGTTVKVDVTNIEGYHDWVLDEFGAKTQRLNAGDRASVEFVADKTGTFQYYCSVGTHRQMGMVGKLIVE